MPPLGEEHFIPPYISTYLESNDAPHDTDIEEIKRSLLDICQSLEKAGEDTNATSRDIETSQKRHATLQETQSKLRSILSPLRRFPAEILSEIFQHAVDTSYCVWETSDGPWSLSHVSRHWRTTALTCSGVIWSVLYVGITIGRFRQNDHLSLLRTCLARSRRHNILVDFDYPQPVSRYKDKALKIVQLLIDNCERWYFFEITNYCPEIYSLLGKVRGRLPNLVDVEIHHGPVSASAAAAPFTAFELAPKLRSVKMHSGLRVVVGPGNPSLISYEDYRRSPPSDPLESYSTILRPFHQQLQTFTSLTVDTRSPETNPPIIMPQLRHFRGSHRDLFQRVTAPNLETFHLDPVRRQSSITKSLLNVLDLFIRSRCSGLSKLALSNIVITTHILDILPLIPALAVLQFHFYDWEGRSAEEDIFRSMFRQMTDEDEVGELKVVPNLREFSFVVTQRHRWNAWFCSTLYFFDGIFLRMVTSRVKILKKVKVIGTIMNGMWHKEDELIFADLLKQGMDISGNDRRPWDFSM
ncbi:hypothetical protein ARMSODRAFT_1089526 [Armillaria solidipes]|uniref:F-box domain-containing protein n=1 Tax=Armillaria solidipes TaxID=1076256 RepID=A0A2H3BAU0_9AGAR|nr:hypothetical protein ARMSODRAFT_1089526 [Armillaria solidipes]